MKITVTDVETSGLDADLNEILEIGLVVFDDQTFEILDTLSVKVIPEHPEICHPKAYEVNGYTPDKWTDAVPLSTAIKIYVEKISDTYFCAHNTTFDYSFIKKALDKNGIVAEDMIDKHKVDIFTLAWSKIPHDKMSKWSLKTICEYLEIPPEPLPHRALNDAMSAYEVYKKLMS